MSHKNYLEHEIKVKAMDAILAKKKEWQWFIDHVDKTFELNDITSWKGFLSATICLREVYSFLIRIFAIAECDVHSNNSILSDTITITKWINAQSDEKEVEQSLLSEYGKALFLVAKITLLENSDNSTEYLLHYDVLQLRNYWQLVNMTSIKGQEDIIHRYASAIRIEGFDQVRKILEGNLDEKEFMYADDFFEKHRLNFYNANAFSYQALSYDGVATWQEKLLLDMLYMSIEDRSIKPALVIGDNQFPEVGRWTEAVIAKMADFFDRPEAQFILETVSYILYHKCPSEEVMLKHCELLSAYIPGHENYELLHASSLHILSYLFDDGYVKQIQKNPVYIGTLQKLQAIEEPYTIQRLRDKRIPISREQKNITKDYFETKYKEIDEISLSHELLDYFRDRDAVKYINNTYFKKVCECFERIISDNNDIIVSSLFYEFMQYLFAVNATSPDVSKAYVRHAINAAQDLWQTEYYEKQCVNMHEFSFETSIPTCEVEAFREAVLNNPLLFASSCMVVDEKEICSSMEVVSEHPLSHMFTKMVLHRVYPMKRSEIKYERHEVDALYSEHVKQIKEKNQHRFRNDMNLDIYVQSIYDSIHQKINLCISMMPSDDVLFDRVCKICEYPLVKSDGEIMAAHVLQLFPCLEMIIREMARVLNYVPFKERIDGEMKYKDPSSILREIIEDVYKETQGFEVIPDLLFVYHSMYNSNGLNVRNDFVHGRDYLDCYRILFAYKITMLSIVMLDYRKNLLVTA